MGKHRPQPVVQAPPPPTSDPWLAYAPLPLRFFLGATFVYAGLQKIADPDFLQPGSSTYIGTQLQAFAAHSPIGFLLDLFALPTPQLTGVAVIGVELGVGVLVIAGIATRWAAAVGALVNVVFFLTASWSVQPYFLGSDSIYAVAWITLVLAGDQGVLTASPLLFGPRAAVKGRASATDLDRRRLLLQLGGAAVAAVWVLAVLPRTRPAASAAQPAASQAPVASPTGTRIGTLANLQAQGFLNFQDPASGDPAVAVSLPGGAVAAFDAVCTHAGCQVSYDTGQRLLACPCHGATFDPARGAAVVSGPAPTALPPIKVQVGSDGGVYAG
jgi:thiosulfate dehydrogenase (quinone) large subunit